MPHSPKALKFYAAVDAGYSRPKALKRAGYKCSTRASADSLACDLLKNRYGKRPDGYTQLPPALKAIWDGLTDGEKLTLDPLTPKERKENLEYLATAKTGQHTLPPPQPPTPPVFPVPALPEPEPIPEPLPYQPRDDSADGGFSPADIDARIRALGREVPIYSPAIESRESQMFRYIVCGGRDISEPERPAYGEWTPATGFRTHEEQAEAAFHKQQQDQHERNMHPISDLRSLRSGKRS